MNDIATEVYTSVTRFENPWPFYIVDNFLPSNFYNYLIQLMYSSSFSLVDSYVSDGIVVPQNIPNRPQKKNLPLYKNENIVNIIDKTIKKHYHNILPQKYYCLPDLIKCDPGYHYYPHKDHIDKAFSVVVFLYPEQGEATTLISESKQQFNIQWRPNRAILFTQKEHGMHTYKNTASRERLTLNVYITLNSNVGFAVNVPIKVIKPINK